MMKNNLISTAILSVSLIGCKIETSILAPEPSPVTSVSFASFNVSFAVDNDQSDNFERWVEFMNIPEKKQQKLIAAWLENTATPADHLLAERIIQIRNIAAIIQKNRPDVLFLSEFNNDGVGQNMAALEGFQKNYLGVSQSMNSVDGGAMLEPIQYPFVQNYATNTGLDPKLNLSHASSPSFNPDDAYGFGFYHGQYAFALMSKFEIDTQNTRTFQTFLRKDLPEAVNPTVNQCTKPLPDGLSCGDPWFTGDNWNKVRLSSKNHVDAPIFIPTNKGIKTIHALLSHPTPPAFDSFSDNNKYRNSDEITFWDHYVSGESFFYDDKGGTGGFKGESFVIMGDLNADPAFGTATVPFFNGIQTLTNNPKLNLDLSQSNALFTPVSQGAMKEANPKRHPHPETRTSTFGSRVDYALASADLSLIKTGVYWQAENQIGRLLFNDPRVGKRGTDKEVSSDHRFVWSTISVN